MLLSLDKGSWFSWRGDGCGSLKVKDRLGFEDIIFRYGLDDSGGGQRFRNSGSSGRTSRIRCVGLVK